MTNGRKSSNLVKSHEPSPSTTLLYSNVRCARTLRKRKHSMKLPPSNIVTVRYISQGQCWGFLCICICSMQTTAKESLKYKILQGWLIDSFKGYGN